MEWTRGRAIGCGSSAIVYVATATASGELFAVKSTELSRSTFLRKEQHFLSQLSCPQIVKYMGFDISSENSNLIYNLFMEYVDGGTLSDQIKHRGGSLDESVIKSYAHQILQGLNYLHLKGMVHCDIKSQNVLVGRDGLKIADLGCARLVKQIQGHGDNATSMFSGTPAFMAPEVARGEKQEFPADVWAFGCTVIEMAAGCIPWPEAENPVSVLYRVGFSGDVPEIPDWLSDDAKDFLGKCLKTNPEERWTAKQLLEHSFLDGSECDNTRQANEFTRNSPTTVLDQGFWDSVEVLDIPRDQTRIGSQSNSPAERIRRLNGDALPSGSDVPNWDRDEDWVTVRSNGNYDISEKETFSDQNFYMTPAVEATVATSSVVASMDLAEAIDNSFIEDNFLFKYYSDYGICMFSSRGGGIFVVCDSNEDASVLTCFNLEIEIIMSYFSPILFLSEA